LKGDLAEQITISMYMENVSRRDADFSANAKIEVDLELQITNSGIVEFVKSAKKTARRQQRKH